MECFKDYEKWVEQYDLDDEGLQKLHKEVSEAQNDFNKISQKIKYGDPVTTDLIMSLQNLNCSWIHFSTAAILKQMERNLARILYQVNKLQEAQERIQEIQDKQQKLHPPQ